MNAIPKLYFPHIACRDVLLDFSLYDARKNSMFVSETPPGTRLCGPVHGCNPANPDNGAFTEYPAADARVLLRVPAVWSDVEVAALGGVGWATVALAMEDCLKLAGRPSAPAQSRADGSRIPVLVYGGATATGTMACQILSK